MLYKYLSLDSKSFDSILKRQEVYFASVKSMNDPFEGRPRFTMPSRTAVKNHLKKKGAKQKDVNLLAQRAMKDLEHNFSTIYAINESYIADTGLLCLTPIRDNLLMWAHYADSHKGVCFGFEVNSPYDGVFGYGYDVIYKDDYPEISLLDLDLVMTHRKKPSALTEEVLETFTDRQLLTKSKSWRYEKEVRFQRPPLSYGVGVLEFPKEQLRSMILGCNMDSANKVEAVDLAIKNFPHIKIYQASLSHDKYQLDILAINC